jgi:hypothetical protein
MSDAVVKTEPPERKHVFRQGIYTAELGKYICNLVAQGLTIKEICNEPGLPTDDCIWLWVADPKHPMGTLYFQAARARVLVWAEEIITISDDGTNDFMERQTRNGVILVADHEHINRSRLRVDTRKFLMSKFMPEVFGDLSNSAQELNLTINLSDPTKVINGK